jgi:sulfofructose kinase
LARDAGIPVVADFENADDPQFSTLLALVDHLILSHGFASRITGESDPAMAARALWTSGRRAVAVTCGRDGCWYVGDEHPAAPYHEPALAVETVDTTGCGDVFHGAYAAALVFGHDTRLALRFASVAAGLKASCHGGQAGIPTRAAVEARLTPLLPL